MDAPPVKSVRGYELFEAIGVGGFSIVYRAYQPAVNCHVAVKGILSEDVRSPEFSRCFESEARLTARLEHPRIVPLCDHWREPDGAAYIVMREMKGGSLGLVLYELLTGRHPFSKAITSEMSVRQLQAPVPSLATELPERSARLGEVIQKATAKNPWIASLLSRICYKPSARRWLKRRRRCLV